jgi:hypothetical protein
MADAARKRFEAERDKTLSELPDNIKDMFGVIGFCQSEFDDDDIVPVLVVSPYDVPPKPVRDIYWYDLFGNAKKSKKLSELAYLVYHYGHVDADTLYSFVEQDEFIAYDVGKEHGYDQLPAELATKVANGETLTEEEDIRVRALKELQEDIVKDKSERKRGLPFQERHEQQLKQPPKKKRKT